MSSPHFVQQSSSVVGIPAAEEPTNLGKFGQPRGKSVNPEEAHVASRDLPSLSVVIPTYSEEEGVPLLTDRVLCLLLTAFSLGTYVNGFAVPGWTSVFAAMLFFGGVQLVCPGLLGEHVGRIFSVVQRRPACHVGYDCPTVATAATAGAPTATTGGMECACVDHSVTTAQPW
jgi:hypothetical protein